MLAEGLGNKDIAARLKISEHTVKFHVSSILGKLRATTRGEAVARGVREGLVVIIEWSRHATQVAQNDDHVSNSNRVIAFHRCSKVQAMTL
jgi:hypothetical protein